MTNKQQFQQTATLSRIIGGKYDLVFDTKNSEQMEFAKRIINTEQVSDVELFLSKATSRGFAKQTQENLFVFYPTILDEGFQF